MTDLTGNALRPAGLTAALAPGATARAQTNAPAGAPRTAAELRAALAALPLGGMRKGYRTEAVDRLVEKVAEELERRAQGAPPFLRSEHVHPNGMSMARHGYATGPARELLEAAAAALQVDQGRPGAARRF